MKKHLQFCSDDTVYTCCSALCSVDEILAVPSHLLKFSILLDFASPRIRNTKCAHMKAQLFLIISPHAQSSSPMDVKSAISGKSFALNRDSVSNDYANFLSTFHWSSFYPIFFLLQATEWVLCLQLRCEGGGEIPKSSACGKIKNT